MSGARFELSPSPVLAMLIVALHAGAAAAVFVVFSGGAAIALGLGLLALGITAAWSRAFLAAGRSVRALEIDGADVTAELKSGERVVVQVAPRRYVSRYFVTLPLSGGLGRTLVVTRDMLDADKFRRLRLWALWGRLPGVASQQLPA